MHLQCCNPSLPAPLSLATLISLVHLSYILTAIGAVLSQLQDGKDTVISYWSRQLTKAERNYSTIEQEALAVVGAVKEFYPLLIWLPF